jgi:pilus assembly protein Flp/PilA
VAANDPLVRNSYIKLTKNPRCIHTFRKELVEMLAYLNALWKNESGVTAIEYGLIAALIAVAIVSVLGTVGSHLSTTFNTVATKL